MPPKPSFGDQRQNVRRVDDQRLNVLEDNYQHLLAGHTSIMQELQRFKLQLDTLDAVRNQLLGAIGILKWLGAGALTSVIIFFLRAAITAK